MIQRVSPQEALRLAEHEGYQQVDVRSQPEFEAGHAKGAVNVPLLHRGPAGLQPNPDFVAVMEANFPKDRRLVLTCLSGNRSMRAAETLAAHGYGALVDQRAGWGGAKDSSGHVVEPGWQGAGQPVESGAGSPTYATLLAKAQPAKQ